ncbi:MAG: hypothetical protein ACI8WA_000433, partial [Polaribacter sp.]
MNTSKTGKQFNIPFTQSKYTYLRFNYRFII